jgi:hypothetical protein
MNLDGIPEEARAGLDEVLARAIGVDRARFADPSSAEAVTWTVFSHLLQTEAAQPCWHVLAGIDGLLPWPSALLFGGEALGDQAEYAREQLLQKTKESWAPDVVLEHWPQRLVFVVARYLKPNPESHDAAAWTRWLAESEAFADPAGARTSGRLDLARAWRLGDELAGRRSFTLVNLLYLPERAQPKAATDLFRSSLNERDGRQFRVLGWRALLNVLPGPWPEWFDRWVTARRLK